MPEAEVIFIPQPASRRRVEFKVQHRDGKVADGVLWACAAMCLSPPIDACLVEPAFEAMIAPLTRSAFGHAVCALSYGGKPDERR